MRAFLVAALSAAFVACCMAGVQRVVRFKIEEAGKSPLGTFKFTNCLPAAKEEFVVNSLTLNPDPLTLPGTLTVSFDANVNNTIGAPLKAVVYLARKVGSTYFKIPCIDQFGSCTYDDLCQLLSQIGQCPKPLVSAGVPCYCPFKAGHYKLPDTSFDVDAAVVPPGDYHGRANLSVNDKTVGCYDLMVSIS